MPKNLSVKDARSFAAAQGFAPVHVTKVHVLLPFSDDMQQFGLTESGRNNWFEKLRATDEEWSHFFARIRKHPFTEHRCPHQFFPALLDAKPGHPFGELLMKQVNERLEHAVTPKNVRNDVVTTREVLRFGDILMHASYENPERRLGYDGYRMKFAHDLGRRGRAAQAPATPIVLTWQQLVDFAVLWLRDELIVRELPWAGEPTGLLSTELAGTAGKTVRVMMPTSEAAPLMTPKQAVVYYAGKLLTAIQPFEGDAALKLAVMTVRPAAEHLVSACGAGETIPQIPDPSALLQEQARLSRESERLQDEARRLGDEDTRLKSQAQQIDKQLELLREQREKLEQLKTDARAEVEKLFAEQERKLIEFRAKVHAEAQALDEIKERLRVLLS